MKIISLIIVALLASPLIFIDSEDSMDMGSLLTVKAIYNSEDYFFEMWSDSQVKEDSIMIYFPDSQSKYVTITDLLHNYKRKEENSKIILFSEFRLFDPSQYLNTGSNYDIWPVYSKVNDFGLDSILNKATDITIETVVPFQGLYFTGALSDFDWSWIKEEDFIHYFTTQIGEDGFCSASLFAPKNKYSDKTLNKIKSQLIEKGNIPIKEYRDFVDYLYYDYDIIIYGYCSC
jgi:hypothetical protein